MNACQACHNLHQTCITEKWKPGGWICTLYENDRPDKMTGEVTPYVRCYEVRAIRDTVAGNCRDFVERKDAGDGPDRTEN